MCSRLDQQEKISLGESWLPIFSEYFSGQSKWILPAIVTLPIILKRFAQVSHAKKEEEIKKQYAMEPEPEPKIEPEIDDETTTLAQQLERELSAIKKEREKLAGLTDRHLANERLTYLRNIGAKDDMSDTDLLLLAPKSDVTTTEGRAAIDAWRENSSVYFDARTFNKPMALGDLVSSFPESEHKTFNQSNALKILKKMTGSKP